MSHHLYQGKHYGPLRGVMFPNVNTTLCVQLELQTS